MAHKIDWKATREMALRKAVMCICKEDCMKQNSNKLAYDMTDEDFHIWRCTMKRHLRKNKQQYSMKYMLITLNKCNYFLFNNPIVSAYARAIRQRLISKITTGVTHSVVTPVVKSPPVNPKMIKRRIQHNKLTDTIRYKMTKVEFEKWYQFRKYHGTSHVNMMNIINASIIKATPSDGVKVCIKARSNLAYLQAIKQRLTNKLKSKVNTNKTSFTDIENVLNASR